MRTRVIVVAAVALLGLLAGCSGGADPSPTGTAGQQTSAASPAASSESSAPASQSPSASASASASASSNPPASDGRKLTAADGNLSWTMPCKQPVKEDVDGNEEDAKTYRSYEGWRCGKRGAATSAVFVLELIKKPADADAARQQMRTALQQVAPNSKATDNDLAGTPGIAGTSAQNGKKFGYQVISFDSYLAVFIAVPPKDLGDLTDTVQVG